MQVSARSVQWGRVAECQERRACCLGVPRTRWRSSTVTSLGYFVRKLLHQTLCVGARPGARSRDYAKSRSDYATLEALGKSAQTKVSIQRAFRQFHSYIFPTSYTKSDVALLGLPATSENVRAAQTLKAFAPLLQTLWDHYFPVQEHFADLGIQVWKCFE